MKINSINQQANNQNFKGIGKFATEAIAKHPMAAVALASSSVVAQKIVMSGSEAVIGPVMDVAIGEAITKATNETDGRTRESSKVQAIRTFSQSVGGTIVGVIIRLACIGAVTALCAKGGGKLGKYLQGLVQDSAKESANVSGKINEYLKEKDLQKWGKNLGGAVATLVMLVTNFIIDAPFINWINKKATDVVDKFDKNSVKNNQAKEVK